MTTKRQRRRIMWKLVYKNPDLITKQLTIWCHGVNDDIRPDSCLWSRVFTADWFSLISGQNQSAKVQYCTLKNLPNVQRPKGAIMHLTDIPNGTRVKIYSFWFIFFSVLHFDGSNCFTQHWSDIIYVHSMLHYFYYSNSISGATNHGDDLTIVILWSPNYCG